MRNLVTKNLIRHIVVLVAISIAMALLGACSSKKEDTQTYMSYIGDECYDSDQMVMLIENIEDEEEPGVIYRDVTDINALLKQKEIPMCVFFYSSNTTDKFGVFAGVEDIAQRLDGRVLIVGVDIMTHRELVDEYGLVAVPDFVLIKDGVLKDNFEASTYDYWTMTDVYNWLILNKI